MGASLSDIKSAGLYATPNTGWLEAIVKGAEAIPPAIDAYQTSRHNAQALRGNDQQAVSNDLKIKDQRMDYYRTLRNAGYDAAQAYEMSLKHYKLPQPSGEMLSTTHARPVSYAQQYETDLAAALDNPDQLEMLKRRYPTKMKEIGEIIKQVTPVTPNPRFREGGGLGAWASKNRARLGENERSVIADIKSNSDLDEFLDDAAAGKIENVDVRAVKEYFGVK